MYFELSFLWLSDFKTKFLSSILGLILHQGRSASCGHYTALVRHSEEWFDFNDKKVTPTPADQLQTQDAYILFYEMSK